MYKKNAPPRVCKYCGAKFTGGGEMCGKCHTKLPLVQKLLALVKGTPLPERRDYV